ncbi:ABC transporter substrate-binding protein [Saccharibacillus sp. CPCC 101409]|uniref:ABC transporter substrate-binding protein n=1 Tax=Saccharibacillus sp. CPCC 101409 TaxID=3058041 RepID=UPI0026728261|nr:ABC transporter substrate-binding protein [Saccharibacillus sp. CPCC 101409]MDO3411999.1 ABC transporter substrate-binding protein [Saccharibacillus sp. CPCC 101409]
MKKGFKTLSVLFILVLTVGLLAACGKAQESKTSAETKSAVRETANSSDTAAAAEADSQTDEQASDAPSDSAERTITYLDREYTVPASAERIVITGSMEAMEDALVLDVHPVGAITYAGEFPKQFASITDNARSIGEKTEPNFETILSLKPDVILGTTKFGDEVVSQLQKIAPTILVSHISSNWRDNLNLMGELTGRSSEAEAAIEKYDADVEAAKTALGQKLDGKTLLAVRIRQGAICVYPSDVFVNAALYGDLGIEVPELIQSTEAQQEISVEQFAEIDPDYVFVQFSGNENADTPEALNDLENNPIIRQTAAFKEGHVFVNVIDPLSEGGPAWSRDLFMQTAAEKLSE